MSFPTSHKTVFIMDHTLTASSGVKLEMDSFSKSRSGSSSNSNIPALTQPINLIPLLPVTKSLWTCAVEAITEYCRIVWDIFPGSRLIRFIAVDKTIHKISSWSPEDQNLPNLSNAFMLLGPAKNIGIGKLDLMKGLKAGIEALTEPSAVQHEKRTSLTESATKVLNKGRIILVTKIDNEDEMRAIKDKFHEALLQLNKVAAATDNLMTINHCDLVLLNLWPEGPGCPIQRKSWPDVSTIMSCEFTNIQGGLSLAPKLCNLVLKHYDLASTTVTGIPMKEEQNASSSANYDVELFHPAAAHTAILRGIPAETAHLKTYREGADYETVTLKWCTPRSNASIELQHCSSAYRITSVDVNSRPSSCLTNFLLNGRWVMLEMPRKSGSKVISHMLACHGGDIYIHTMYTARSILEDPPSISEGCGGRVTDYRIPDFGEFIKANKLAPYPDTTPTGEDASVPLERSRDQLTRHTKYWPITISSTSLFTLGSYIDPLTNFLVKSTMTEDEVIECKQVILNLMSMEARGDPLPSPMASQRSKGMKREDQYRAVWAELEQYLQMHLHSPAHEKVLECFMECHNKVVSPEYKSDDKVDIDQALKELDDYNYMTEREKSDFNTSSGTKHTPPDLPVSDSKRRHTSAPPPLAPMGRSSGVNLLALWENKVVSVHSQCLEFQGRKRAEGNVTKLYVNLQKEKEKDDGSRKK